METIQFMVPVTVASVISIIALTIALFRSKGDDTSIGITIGILVCVIAPLIVINGNQCGYYGSLAQGITPEQVNNLPFLVAPLVIVVVSAISLAVVSFFCEGKAWLSMAIIPIIIAYAIAVGTGQTDYYRVVDQSFQSVDIVMNELD